LLDRQSGRILPSPPLPVKAIAAYSRMGRALPIFSCRGRIFRFIGGALPVSGLRSMTSQEMARASYSRRPQTSHTQAGKLGTVTSSSSSQVKYVICRRCNTPAWHSEHWDETRGLSVIGSLSGLRSEWIHQRLSRSGSRPRRSLPAHSGASECRLQL